MYWDWLLYFAQRPGSADLYRWAVAWYWKVFYTFYCLAGAAGNRKELQEGFNFHLKHLRGVLPDILRCPHVSLFERVRALVFCFSPGFAYSLARLWGRAAGPA